MKRILWFFILFIFSLGIFQYALAQPNELTLLKKINVAASVDNTRIEIRFNGAPLQEKIHYREDSLQIEFPDSFISPAKQSYKVEDDIVKNIVAYQFDDTTVRVRLFTYGKSENLRDKIRFSRDINKVIIVYNQETGTPDKETRVSLRDTKGDGKGFSDKTGMSPGSQNGMKITPPLNPLPQGEGRYERLPIIPPPLTGGGEGEGERRGFSDENNKVQLSAVPETVSPLPSPPQITPHPPINTSGASFIPPPLVGGGYGGGGEGKGEGVLSNNSPDITASIFKMVLALGIVLSLLFAAVFLFKKFFGGKIGLAGKGQQIRVITSTYLGPKKSIAVVDVAGERIVVGVTPTHITMLTRLRNDDEFKDLLNERMTSPNNKPNNKPNNEVELNDDLWEKV